MRNNDSIDQLLTALFMLLAVAAIVIFFVVKDRTPFYWVGGIAVAIRLLHYGRRVFVKLGQRRKRASELDI